MGVKIKRLWLWALTGVLVLAAVTGCSGTKKEAGEKAADSGNQEISLKFIWWGKQQRKEDTLKVIELYQKSHPNVTIRAEDFSGKDEVATRLAIETADQDTADIIQGDYSFIFDYIDRDLIEPLGPYIQNKTLSTANISADILAPGMKGKELYAVNIGMNSEAVLYDPAFFEKAGVAVPGKDYTLDDLYHAAVQLKEAVDEPDFYPLGNLFTVNYYLRTRGSSMYNADGTDLGYEDDGIVADYLSLYKKWMDEGLLSPDSLTEAAVDETHPVLTGKSAFYFGYSNNSNALSKLAGHTIKLLPLPKVSENGEGRFIKPSQFLAVSSYSKHPEEAARFIDFFINNTEANDILKGERGVPVSSVISARLQEKMDEPGKQQYELLDYLKTHSSPIDPPAPGADVVVNNIYKLELKHVLSGSVTPQQGAKEFRTQAEGILQGKGGAEAK